LTRQKKERHNSAQMQSFSRFMQRATEAHRSGRFEEAEQAYLEALRVKAGSADALRLLGALYVQMGRFAEAESRLNAALLVQPNNPETRNHLGRALCNQGRLAEAAACFEQTVRRNPESLQALRSLARIYQGLERRDEAMELLKRVLGLDASDATAHGDLAELLRRQDKAKESIPHYEHALRLDPTSPGILTNLGIALRDVGRATQALDCFWHALQRRPEEAAAHINYGAALRDLGRLDEAEAAYRTALRLQPGLAEAEVNIGALRQDRMRHEAAIRHFDRALAMTPDLVAAKWNKALSLLALGRYEEGWALYESGLGHRHLRGVDRHPPAKRWDGAPCPGKRLLLRAEQGFGDALQFVRYARLCRERGATAIVLAPPALGRLFAHCPGVHAVVETLAEAAYDFHIPMMSLPFAFKTTLATIPAETPYVFVSEAARTQWAPCFEGTGRPRVGLVWAGNPREHHAQAHLVDRRRSMRLEDFLPFFTVKDIAFHSLQKDAPPDLIAGLGLGGRLIDRMPDVADFMDTAALIEQLDLVISVDTSVVHLAGAMGKPVWLLSRFDACWRWLGNQQTNPWYPTARVFGQPAPGDWETVVANVVEALHEWKRLYRPG
jgi:tetratricopeptide (TPR) repeat protein